LHYIVELVKKIEAINPKNKEDAANRSSNTEVFDISQKDWCMGKQKE